MQMISRLLRQHKVANLSLYKIVFPNDKDLRIKIEWIKANEHKKYHWWQWIALDDVKKMFKNTFILEVEDMADWMIRQRTVEVNENRICFNPRAFCWESGKRLFLKRATVVHTLVIGPGDPLKETFYFEPKRYTMWLLKQ
jgi:hypothetical protein